MPFTHEERRQLLAQPRLGAVVIERLESAGFDSFERLRAVGVDEVVRTVCARLGSTAWANRRQALLEAIHPHHSTPRR